MAKKQVLLTNQELKDILNNEYQIRVTNGDKKLGQFIYTINLPTTICPQNAPCKKGCYAKKGNYMYSNIQNAYNLNLQAYLMDKKAYFDRLSDFLLNGDIIFKYFRYHASGDIVDYDYLRGMVRVANENPQTKFLCYTKKYTLVNMYLEFNTLPSNLIIVFSGWDNSWEINNPHNLPTTYVEFKKNNHPQVANAKLHCTSDCKVCKKCWNLKNGEVLVFKKH